MNMILMKHHSLLFGCLFLMGSYLVAAIPDADMQDANLYFQAGDYQKAGSLLKSKVDEDLQPWQKEIVTYDYGTTLLGQGRWEDALTTYDTIEVNKDSAPLLAKYLETNRALALLLLANSKNAILKKDVKATVEDYNAAIFLYREAIRGIEKAHEEACRLSLAEGASSCEQYLDLEEMQIEAKQQYDDLVEHYTNFLQKKISEGGKTWNDEVQRILYHYSLLLLSENIQERQLQSLLEQLSLLDPFLDKEGNGGRKQLYAEAKHNLELAQKAIKNDKLLQGRLYVEESSYFMKKLAQSFDRLGKNDPVHILKDLIDGQELALRMNRIRLTFTLDDKEADKLLRSSQSRLLHQAETFFPAVIAKQKQLFQQEKLCQKSPWEDAVPLFNRGFDDANRANQRLTSEPSLLHAAAKEQANALKAWKEVLNMLQINKRSEKKESPQQAEEMKPQGTGQGPTEKQRRLKPAQPGGSDLNDVLRLLQEMENDDRSKPQMIESSSKKEVEHPW